MRVFVACSASNSADLGYRNLATELSTYLAKHNHKLVFGGSDTGMMGKCYMTFKYEGGKTKAIAEMHDKDVLESLEVDASEITTNTFDRTKLLYESSELVIILPGGIGTFAELFSILDEIRTKKSRVPIVLFNYNDFYTPLLKFLRKCHDELLISTNDLKLLNVVTDLSNLEKYIERLELKKET